MAIPSTAVVPEHPPIFLPGADQSDPLMVGMGIFMLVAVIGVGLLFLRIHTLPERMAHRSQKLQFEIVAVLGLLALFTHQHAFWVAGLLLALVDLPDFGRPLGRIAGSLETLAGLPPGGGIRETGETGEPGSAPSTPAAREH